MSYQGPTTCYVVIVAGCMLGILAASFILEMMRKK
jgi:hypothetical protein